MSVNFNPERTYSYIKGMAMGLGWMNTLKALPYARALHQDQTRKSGEPYIVHPLIVAGHAIALGIHEDRIIAACLLHDVIEDCGAISSDLPVDAETQVFVQALTHIKGTSMDKYYARIREYREACIVKLLDRCNNVSTMAGVFTTEKIRDYIKETRDYVLPLLRYTKETWPETSEKVFVLKYHIVSLIDGLELCLNSMER